MGWRENLRTASFSGVEFGVRSAEASGGRRTAVHEFAASDKHQTEDLGRKARTFSLEGFVVGSDYMSRRDALQDALDAGPGKLVHPYRGTLSVVCATYRISESADSGGLAVFSMEFQTMGEAVTPGASVSTSSLVGQRADAASLASISAFDQTFDMSGPSWTKKAAVETVSDLVDTISAGRRYVGSATDYASIVADLSDLDASSLASMVSSGGLGSALASLFGFSESASSVTSLYSSVLDAADSLSAARELLDLFDDLGGGTSTSGATSSSTSSSAVSSSTSSAARILANASAVQILARQQAVVEAARASAWTEPETADEALELMDALTGAVDEVQAESEDDEVYGTFSALRAAVVSDLATRAARLPELTEISLRAPSPSLAVAQLAYADGSRGDEIVTRNAVRHPGFVPAGSVEVLNG